MHDLVLTKIRERVKTGDYVMTRHALHEMDDDDLMLADVEGCMMNGEIVERQRDLSTGEWKYRLSGAALNGDPVEVIAKLGPTGKIVVITVFRFQRGEQP
ncbi:MAG: DUF4258 domain-containing protein [Planctomycetes bacterium]|nr:DUF4258 domain-containing protein [Planctomycetota bacterium]